MTALRDGAPDSLLTGWASWRPLVAAWFGGQVTALELPVIGGKVSYDATASVQSSLTLAVPRFSASSLGGGGPRRRVDWLPPGDDPTHPLERFGQELTVAVAVGSPLRGGLEFVTDLGRFTIQETGEADDGSVEVRAAGRLQIIADDGLTTPVQPRPDGTLASEFARLLPDGFVVEVDPELTDRRVPQTLEWGDDRMAALRSIVDAWPARMREDTDGNIELRPPLPAVVVPDLTLSDGERGTLVSAPRLTTRAGTFNVVVARGEATEEGRPPVQAVASVPAGPLAPATYHAVTAYYASPLLTTDAQAASAAATRLANLIRPGRTVTVTHVPDPRIALDVAVRARREASEWAGYVVGAEIPLTVKDGAQTTIIGVG